MVERGSYLIETTDDLTTVVRVTGEFDGDECEDLRDALVACAVRSRTVEVDLRGVEFVGSRFLGALISARQGAAAAGATLVITGSSAAVDRLFQATGSTDLFGAESD